MKRGTTCRADHEAAAKGAAVNLQSFGCTPQALNALGAILFAYNFR